jgi:hypothetical protein
MTHRPETGTTDTHRPQAHRILPTLVATTLLLAASAADAALTTGKCLALKRQAWGNLRKCQAAEEIKQLKGKPADLAKCQTKFQEKLAKVSGKATEAAIACRYGDNGDGTVTDYDTGLQWEQKTGLFVIGLGIVCVPGNPLHCVNNTYDWDEANKFVDASANGVTLNTCFSDHCDWRLPTIVQLQTILLAPFPCGTSPCIDPIFGLTAAEQYWTSTTDDTAPGVADAWYVDFDDGLLEEPGKSTSLYVRVVRGAL